MNMPLSKQLHRVIAGRRGGKRVVVLGDAVPAYQQLEQAALRGNHWARVAVDGVKSLSAGTNHLRNLYCRPNQHPANGNKGSFFLFMPGLTFVVEHWANDSFAVRNMVLDAKYFEAGEEAKPGLYRVSKGIYGWNAEHLNSGSVLPDKGRPVAIADAGYVGSQHAARACVRAVTKSPEVGRSAIERDGFDMHFTPGEKRVGGLRRYNAMEVTSTYGSAVLLAETMQKARDIAGVQWVSEYGGSAILTQAMQILATRGVKLENHGVFMYQCKTSPDMAVRLAHQLHMTLDEKFASTRLDPVGTVSKMASARARIQDPHDRYSLASHAQNWLTGLVRTAGWVGTGALTATYLGAAMPAVQAMAGIITAAATGAGVVAGVGNTVTLGTSLVESTRHKLGAKR